MALDLNTDSQYINGAWRESDGEESIDVINPSTEEVLSVVPVATESEVRAALEAAEAARNDWARRPAKERGDIVREIARVVSEHADEIAPIIAQEQGKPLSSARGEVGSFVEYGEYVAGWDRRIEGDIVPSDSRNESIHLQRHPHGVVAAITPWNYPVTLFMRKVGPALVTGNTVVIKPSEVTPLANLTLMELIDEHVDVPPGVLNFVVGGGSVGEQLVTAPETNMVTMTGSVETGKKIMRAAADDMTKISLELGGKAPAIVLADADLDSAVENILTARVTNTGQVCTCAERIYVHADVRTEFERKYVSAAENITIGDPFDDPDMGPQVNEQERDETERIVNQTIDNGAELLTGGSRPTGEGYERGYWFAPTVLTGVENDMEIMQNEVFGPVSPIAEISSLEEALELANDSRYGLSSYIFTDDYRTAMRAVNDIDFGEVYINRTLGESWQGHHIGWNESGVGGEDGKYGVLKYTQIKTVYHDYS